MFYLTNDAFRIKNTRASRVGLKQPRQPAMPGKVVPSVGCGQLGNEMGSHNGRRLAPNRGSSTLPKSPSKHEVRGDVASSLAFRPHAIIVTERSIPSPIFVAALIGVERILRIELDSSLPEQTYVQQALAKLPEQTIAFGRPIGVTVNYALDRAVRYDLKGNSIETLAEAVRCGKAYLTIPPSKKDMSVRIGKALGLRSIS